tara:strand:+ start:2009 stop:2608 length:600 start_codon:yes stop_codon:yes gene_type:complete
MRDAINWGIPNAGRTKKEEQFNTPVVTMSAIIKDGAGRKFSFNKAAAEALGLVKPDENNASYVSFGFNGNDLYCKSSITEGNFKTNKSFSFSDKKMFEYIVKSKELSISSENYLHLEEVEGEGMFKIVKTTSNNDGGEQLSIEIPTSEIVLDEVETVEETPPTMQDTYDLVEEQKAEELGEEEEEKELEEVEEVESSEW